LSPGQRSFVSKGRKRVSIPPVMRQVGSNLRQNSCPLRSSNKTTSLERIHPTGEDKGGGGLDTLGRLVTVERTDDALSACGGLAASRAFAGPMGSQWSLSGASVEPPGSLRVYSGWLPVGHQIASG
jgi:hypothetical protein